MSGWKGTLQKESRWPPSTTFLLMAEAISNALTRRGLLPATHALRARGRNDMPRNDNAQFQWLS